LAFSIPLVARLGEVDANEYENMSQFRHEVDRVKQAHAKERRADDFVPHPRGLVLAPTRELANQINDVLMPLAQIYGINTTTVYGGVRYARQIRDLQAGADIVVACPGRLEDLIEQGALTLDKVEVAVIDEADEMADMGFLPPVKRLLGQISFDAQIMLFSATLDHGVDEVVETFLSDPKVHSVDSATATVDEMTHHVFKTTQGNRHELVRTLASGKGRRILFTRTKFQTQKLAKDLTQNGIPAAELHGNLSQNQRDRVMKKFREGAVDVLIATDVAARGIDVDNITHVINFDIPQDPESYVHRIGRTGRAGNTGVAMTFITPREFRQLKLIERTVKTKIQRRQLPTAANVIERQRDQIISKMQTVLELNAYHDYMPIAESLLDDYSAEEVAAAALKLMQEGIKALEAPQEDILSKDLRNTGGRPGMVRLFINIGRSQKIMVKDIVSTIAIEADIPARDIGLINIYDKFTFVEVPEDVAEKVIGAMNKNFIKGYKVNIEPAKARR